MRLANEACDSRGMANRAPRVDRLVGEVHPNEHVAGELVALDRLALALLDLNNFLDRNLDLEDVVLHVQGLAAALDVRLDLVLVPGVGVDDVPVAWCVAHCLAELLNGVQFGGFFGEGLGFGHNFSLSKFFLSLDRDLRRHFFGDELFNNGLSNELFGDGLGHCFFDDGFFNDFFGELDGCNLFSDCLGDDFFGNLLGDQLFSRRLGDDLSHKFGIRAFGKCLGRYLVNNRLVDHRVNNDLGSHGLGHCFTNDSLFDDFVGHRERFGLFDDRFFDDCLSNHLGCKFVNNCVSHDLGSNFFSCDRVIHGIVQFVAGFAVIVRLVLGHFSPHSSISWST